MAQHAGLHIVQSNRLENLARRFAGVCIDLPLSSPLLPELVVVHDRTVGEWLDLTLARMQGISANVNYRSPGQLIWDIYRGAGLTDNAHSAYDTEVLRWHILRIFDDISFVDRFEALRTYLTGAGAARRFDLAIRLAGLFDRYLVYRMDWLRTWETGSMRGLGSDEVWQAELWRRLTREVQVPHRAELFRRFIETPDLQIPGLPERVSVFGISSLSPAYVEILHALGRRIPVHVYLLNPSAEKWDDIADERHRAKTDLAYSADLMHVDVPHALLGSLGKQGRDFIRFAVEAEGVGTGTENIYEDPGVDTMLHTLQSGILHLSEEAAPAPGPDGSVQIHACHSRMREVEVVRDRLLAMFDVDRTLLPSDILVLAPDIDAYAPYCEAVFQRRLIAPDGRHSVPLPYDIAERSSGQVDVVIDTWQRLLDLPLSRCDADRVLDLLRLEPVSASFGISGGDLDTIAGWVEEAGIRWGLSGEQKTRWNLPVSDAFSWSWGLDRMVLGVGLPRAMAGDALPIFHGLLPYDAIEGQQVDLLDRFIAFVDALKGWIADLEQPRPLEEWEQVLSAWLDTFTGTAREYMESRETLRGVLADAVTAADEAAYGTVVDAAILRVLFSSLDASSGSGARFLGGGITFASMKPMRPLPYRVIVLLGMGDGEFPRTIKPPSFDLMQMWYRHGDRSARLDDRYLFLELLLSARNSLIITYVGEDIRSGKTRAMSPVLAELVEFIGRTRFAKPDQAGFDHVRAATKALVITHPLQSFSAKYFDGSDGRLFSYSNDACRIAGEAGRGLCTFHELFAHGLPAPGEEFRRVRLEDLCRFYSNPCAYLFNKRLGVYYREEEEGIEVLEPLSVGKPETRAIYKALCETLPRGDFKPDVVRSLLEAGGQLPVGVTGTFGFGRILEQAGPFIDAYRTILGIPCLPAVSAVRTFGGWTLEIDHPRITRDGIQAIKPGKIYDRDITSFWVRMIAVSVVHPSRGRAPQKGTLLGVNALVEFQPVKTAEALLERLLYWYGVGLQRPLHFFPGYAFDYARGLEKGEPEAVLAKLRHTWDHPTDFGGFTDAQDPYIASAFDSGKDALSDEFVTLAREITMRLCEGMTRTELIRKGK